MNADGLREIFDRVADASDATARLRRFVLDLAVRGKLVEQDPNDKPASELLAHARHSLQKRARTVRRLRWKTTEPVDFDEVKKDTPRGWVTARINDTGLYINGLAFKPADWKQSGLPIIRIQNLTDPAKEFNFAQGDFPDEVLVRDGDLLVSWSATLEAFKWDRGKAVLNQHIFRVLPNDRLITRNFLLVLLRNAIREMAESDHAHGLVMTHINRGPFLNHVVLIPPLAEQHRIVAEVDELMDLCDQLEEGRIARKQTRAQLTKASFARLIESEVDATTFRSQARFTIDTIPALTARADQIIRLRDTILDLAVRGKLVEQKPEDEPASELLHRIESEKTRLWKARKIRKPRSIKPLDPDELPFRLAAGWQWTQIAHLGVINPRNEAPDDDEASFVPMRAIAAEYGVSNEHESRPWGEIKKGYTHFAEGDVGLAKITPCFENRKSTVFRNLTGGFGSGTTELHIIRPLFVFANYIILFLKTPHFIDTGIPKMTGTAGQKRVPTEHFTSSPFPLPPLAEQHRIVAKVDELMALCDRLEANLSQINAIRSHLLELVLRTAI